MNRYQSIMVAAAIGTMGLVGLKTYNDGHKQLVAEVIPSVPAAMEPTKTPPKLDQSSEYLKMIKDPKTKQTIVIVVAEDGKLNVAYNCNAQSAALAAVYLQAVALKMVK